MSKEAREYINISTVVASVRIGGKFTNHQLKSRSGDILNDAMAGRFTRTAKCLRELGTVAALNMEEETQSPPQSVVYQRVVGAGKNAEFCTRSKCDHIAHCLLAMYAQSNENLKFRDKRLVHLAFHAA